MISEERLYELIEKVEIGILKDYGIINAYNDNVRLYALHHWFMLIPDALSDTNLSIFDNNIYPKVKVDLNVKEDGTM